MLSVFGIDHKEWASRYGIKIKRGKCPMCDKMVVTNIPFATKDVRGLKSKDHGCGEKYTRKVMVLIKGELKNLVNKIL